MMHSVVVIREATDAASARAVRTTFVGSMMPSLIMSTYWPVCALKPMLPSALSMIVRTTTWPSSPAFWAIWMQGCLSAALMASTPTCWSRLSSFRASSFLDARRSAVPPPGTMPSSRAAFVAQSASFRRSLVSFTSTSLAPPTLMTATPPESLASRSFILSFSYSEAEWSMESRMLSQRSLMAALSPAPSSMMVSSFVMVTVLQEPSWSRVMSSSLPPSSSLISSAPVRTARSLRIAFLLSPKPGDLRAHTFRPPRSLLTMSMARASLSTSSATMSRGFESFATCSRSGRIDCTVEIFLSKSMMRGFSISTVCSLLLVMK
mmetsp:Transcript_72380/g.156547  ORF Transcript_72380/g.156547 Transcript_72380/m.156547 type:complete len:320 (+) Transcript_72380:173-1132(+)